MTTRDFTPPTTAADLSRDVVSDGISDAPCAVALYPIPELSLRDPVDAVVDRLKLACWGTMLVVCSATVMTIVTTHWALGSVSVTALKRIRAARRRRAGVGRTTSTGLPLLFPSGKLTTRTPLHGTRPVRWEPPLAETA
jgi:hypothetical protein